MAGGKHINDVTKRWLSRTPNPPFILIFYTHTKIHKPKPVGRPIISGCGGRTERISAFLFPLLQPIAKIQQSFIKDSTDSMNFMEKTKIGQGTILVSMDVSRFCAIILQKEGTKLVCNHTKSSTILIHQSPHPS